MDAHATAQGRDAALADFKQIFRQLAPYKHRYEVFKDFVTMAACSLHNAVHKDAAREEEYQRIVGQYKPDDQRVFGKLLARLVAALEHEPRDVLGPLYMELEIASKDQGQFFSPPDLSEMMARMTFAPELDKLETQPFITAGEPAAGAGGMILALTKVLIQAGHDPLRTLWVQAIDVERLAALMCYIQLSLWNVPAEVIVGNTLSWDIREVWYTPAHHLGMWKYRLRRKEGSTEVAPAPTEPTPEPVATPPDSEDLKPAPVSKSTQLGFDF
jgi:type I restriction-modification system DNA methylase subunit